MLCHLISCFGKYELAKTRAVANEEKAINMDTPPYPRRSSIWSDMLASLMPALWALFYVGMGVWIIRSGALPTNGSSEYNGFSSGFVHGYYIIASFLASAISDEYTLYQAGADFGYNIGYLIGIYLLYRAIVAYRFFKELVS